MDSVAKIQFLQFFRTFFSAPRWGIDDPHDLHSDLAILIEYFHTISETKILDFPCSRLHRMISYDIEPNRPKSSADFAGPLFQARKSRKSYRLMN